MGTAACAAAAPSVRNPPPQPPPPPPPNAGSTHVGLGGAGTALASPTSSPTPPASSSFSSSCTGAKWRRHLAAPQAGPPEKDTNCTTPSLIPTGTGNAVLALCYTRTTARLPRTLNRGLTLQHHLSDVLPPQWFGEAYRFAVSQSSFTPSSCRCTRRTVSATPNASLRMPSLRVSNLLYTREVGHSERDGDGDTVGGGWRGAARCWAYDRSVRRHGHLRRHERRLGSRRRRRRRRCAAREPCRSGWRRLRRVALVAALFVHDELVDLLSRGPAVSTHV
jgi:hypothetical protein